MSNWQDEVSSGRTRQGYDGWVEHQIEAHGLNRVKPSEIPKDFPVRPLRAGQRAIDRATCGTCGLSWDDGKSTSYTPAPSARCPFEYFHH